MILRTPCLLVAFLTFSMALFTEGSLELKANNNDIYAVLNVNMLEKQNKYNTWRVLSE